MIVVDVNLLLYATVESFPQHDRTRIWWEGAINDGTPIGLPAPSLFGFVRVATNQRVLATPMTTARAVGYVREWLGQPNITFLPPGPEHVDIALGLLENLATAGNLTTDVQLAAIAIEYDAEICSNDTDFGRFPEVRWLNPIQ